MKGCNKGLTLDERIKRLKELHAELEDGDLRAIVNKAIENLERLIKDLEYPRRTKDGTEGDK